MALLVVHILLAGTFLASAQVYIPAALGPVSRPQCATTAVQLVPKYSYTPFSFTNTDTVRYATSRPAPTATTTFAAPLEALTTLLPPLSFTTWGKWDANSTERARDAYDSYGRAAWTELWRHANPPNFTETDCYNFPPGFEFGVAGSASQIEGATADEGKAPSLMDIVIQDSRPKSYVTNEFYYCYKQDIERLASMGVKYFSFSIAWTRILPFALPGTPVNRQGIDHYNDMINFILEKGMIPVATLLHFDIPLQFFGDNISLAPTHREIGYRNETFSDAFLNYAKIVMAHYADRVPLWFTINEPFTSDARAVDNFIKSHARVSHFYKDELKGTGKISLKFSDNFGVPRNPLSEVDVFAANHFNSIQLGTFCNPIFLGEDYPDSFKRTYPDFKPLSKQDLKYINGTADFLGIDPYTATVISSPIPGDKNSIFDCITNSSSPYRPYCVNATAVNQFGWNNGYRSQSYVYSTAPFLRTYLNYLYNTWHTPISITEFGFPVFGESEKELPDQLFDTPRSQYYLSFLSEVLKAIWEDGVEVIGAYAWSFQDNWEFGDYKQQFGIQAVNRTTKQRRYKKSFFDLVDFMNARGVV
ncbi:hypothetical protein QQS21_000386 [Conoideocrella luteorostrata]|uniref:Beta-glucosidase n=1 Tax=Conoideocrella luteorostrata TaxID=1105319 RepID=A0AAJ0FYM6_9HYPO|nr:hypothetical protein QQS21_000386 [Conoideocrella luteorostrata]